MKEIQIEEQTFSFKQIRKKVIDSVYRDTEHSLGQYVAAICLEAPMRELRRMFAGLPKELVGELANILTNETSLLGNKFTKRTETYGFTLFRNNVFVKKINWQEFSRVDTRDSAEKSNHEIDVFDILFDIYVTSRVEISTAV